MVALSLQAFSPRPHTPPFSFHRYDAKERVCIVLFVHLLLPVIGRVPRFGILHLDALAHSVVLGLTNPCFIYIYLLPCFAASRFPCVFTYLYSGTPLTLSMISCFYICFYVLLCFFLL